MPGDERRQKSRSFHTLSAMTDLVQVMACAAPAVPGRSCYELVLMLMKAHIIHT
jgi:hypothetical protein